MINNCNIVLDINPIPTIYWEYGVLSAGKAAAEILTKVHNKETAMKRTLMLGIFAFLCVFGFAQTMGNYSFTTGSATYTEITGGIVLGNESTDAQRFVDPIVPWAAQPTREWAFRWASISILAARSSTGWASAPTAGSGWGSPGNRFR